VAQTQVNPCLELYIDRRYILNVLKSLAEKTTRDIHDGVNSRQARKLPRELHNKARRLLDQINAAPTLDMLRLPPSNRLEKLKGDWAGFWSLRINDQWHIVFRWQGQDAMDVQVIDYQ
jgi:toxin HigB-1